VPNPQESLYEAVGGIAFFRELVDRFYDSVAADPDLLSVYPHPDDLGPARERLTLFLAQYWGDRTRTARNEGIRAFECGTSLSR